MSIQILHNPRCSKSRQTLALLEENGVSPEVVEYLKTPPTAEQLADIVKKLGVSVRDIIRVKEAEYKETGADNDALSDEAVINILITTPKLIERPIVINGDKAAIGRPPENVLAII
jgi:arsenate reductase